jgi:hypothetical protein
MGKRETKVDLLLSATFHYGAGKLAQAILHSEACTDILAEHFIDESSTTRFLSHFYNEEATAILQSLREDTHLTPPFRLNIYHAGRSTFMVLSIHHVLYDGVSLPIILRTVADIYLEISNEKEIQPMESFLRVLALPKGRDPVHFWKQYLDGIDTITPRPTSSTKPDSASRKLSLPLSMATKKAADSQVTLNALLSSTFGLAIAPEGASEVVLGVNPRYFIRLSIY